MKTQTVLGLVALVPLFAVGCSSMTKAKIDHESLAPTKRAAIVGFHLGVQKPKSIAGEFNKVKDLAHGKIKSFNDEDPMADELYSELAVRLKSEMQWSMMSQSAISKNAFYQQLLNEFTTGLQLRGGPVSYGGRQEFDQFRPTGIVDADPFIKKIKRERREALMNALGVDALVVDNVMASLKNESTFGGMVGAAKYRPRTQNIIRVYVRGKDDPVWFDTWAWGEGDKAIQSALNYVGDKALFQQVAIATGKSFSETFSRFKQF